MIKTAENTIPKTAGLPKRPVVPWWTKRCEVARKTTRTCFRRYLRSPCEANRIAYAKARAKQKRTFKDAKRTCWRKYISELTMKTPSSQIWNKIRKLQGKFVPNPLPILKIGEEHISDPKEVAETLGAHFASVSSAAHYSQEFQNIRNSTTVTPPFSNNTEAFNMPFSLAEMSYALSSSSLTSPGEDDIRYEMIIHLPECTKIFLLDILNGMWTSHTSPESWDLSVLIPGHKPGKNPELPQNYRPIALTSCMCKLLERMINNRLVWYLESKNLLSNRQFGFRKNRSTLDPLLMLSRQIQNAFARHHQTIGVFFDLEKAYDTTWRGGILKQLVSWGIGGHMYAFINGFLSNRYLKVRVGSAFSTSYLQDEGVPQGSVLSVTLFAIAINSLMDHIPSEVQGSLFVDDFAIYCSASTALEAGRKIQAMINAVTKWADARGFTFSPQKTKAIRFTRKRKQEEIPTLFLKDSIIPYETEVKFLGVIFDKGLTFCSHINDLCNRVRLSLNILKVVSHLEWGADRATLLRLYTTLCLSKIDYACQVYGSAAKTTLAKLDIVHNMGLRICTGAYRTSPIDSIYVDSGIPPLSIRRMELGLRHITKSLTSNNNPNYKYVKNPTDLSPNRPQMPKPLEVRLAKESREIGIHESEIAILGPSKYPPWCRPEVEICICRDGKQQKDPQIIKAEFLEHSAQHSGQCSIYTDGSKSSNGVGSAAVIADTVVKRKLPSSCSNFTAEIHAVLMAVKNIFYSDDQRKQFVIYTDSNSVLHSL